MRLIEVTRPKIRGDNGNHRAENQLKDLTENERPKPGTKPAQLVFFYLPKGQRVLPLQLPVQFFPGNFQIIEISCWHNPSVGSLNAFLICLAWWRHSFQ